MIRFTHRDAQRKYEEMLVNHPYLRDLKTKINYGCIGKPGEINEKSYLISDKIKMNKLFEKHINKKFRIKTFFVKSRKIRVPFVVKARFGFRGSGKRLENNIASVDWENEYVQEFVNIVSEYRVNLLSDGRYYHCYRKISIAEWKRDGDLYDIVPPAYLLPAIAEAGKFLKKIGLGFGGFDFAKLQDGRVVIIEVNSAAWTSGNAIRKLIIALCEKERIKGRTM